MRILYVCSHYPPESHAGISNVVRTLATKIAAMGHEVSVVGYARDDGKREDQGVKVFQLPLKVGWWPRLTRRKHLADWIEDYSSRVGIDIVEWPDFEGLFWRHIPEVIDVVRLHGSKHSLHLAGFVNQSYIERWLEFRTLRSISNWIGVSDYFLQESIRIIGAHPKKHDVIYNPVDTSLFKPEGDHAPKLILFAGSLIASKGIFPLSKAARIFLDKEPHARLVFIGQDVNHDGRSAKGIILENAGEKVQDRIKFLPALPQRDIVEWVQRASVFVMPSFLESFCCSWVEAMACETPVVGSILTAGPEVIGDIDKDKDAGGLLADPYRPEDIAEKVLRILRDVELAKFLGKNGRKRAVARFSLEKCIHNTLAFYMVCLTKERKMHE